MGLTREQRKRYENRMEALKWMKNVYPNGFEPKQLKEEFPDLFDTNKQARNFLMNLKTRERYRNGDMPVKSNEPTMNDVYKQLNSLWRVTA